MAGDVDVMITEEEKAYFLSISADFRRDAFIERFWKERDPELRTSTNELRRAWEERAARAPARYPSLLDARSWVLMLKVDGGHEVRAMSGYCSGLTRFALGVLAFVLVLTLPMVLSFTSEAVLGLVLAAGSGGLAAGSLAMIVTGGPRRRIRGILAGGLLSGLALGAAGLLIGGALFVMMFGFPITHACSQAIWQSKVPPDVQGRVFAVRRMIAQLSGPVGYLLAGPLADRLFEPLMAGGGVLASTLGPWIGSGPGRGIGLLFLCLGAIPVLSTLAIYSQPRIRRVEDELPDTVP